MSRAFLKSLLFCLCLVTFAMPVNAQDRYPFAAKEEADRFHALIQEIRCVVCQNQSIADSNAPLAQDLREKIYQFVIEKKSNTEIKAYLTGRYGEFILLQPPLSMRTALLWLFPLMGLMITALVLYACLGRKIIPVIQLNDGHER